MTKITKNDQSFAAHHKIRNQKITEGEINKAFKIWYRKQQFKNMDQASSNGDLINSKSCLKEIRHALQLSAQSVAGQLNVSRSAYSKYEDSESKGVITLETLSKAAQAMDCELIYAIVPKNKKSISEIIWERLLPVSIIHPWIKNCDPFKKAEALAFIMGRNFADAKTRKKLGWSQNSVAISNEK